MPDSTQYYFNPPRTQRNYLSSFPLTFKISPFVRLIRHYSYLTEEHNYYESFLPAVIGILKTTTSLHASPSKSLLTRKPRPTSTTLTCCPSHIWRILSPYRSLCRLWVRFHTQGTKFSAGEGLVEQGVLVIHLNKETPVSDIFRYYRYFDFFSRHHGISTHTWNCQRNGRL